MGLLLFVLSLILALVLCTVFTIYTFIKYLFSLKFKKLNKWLYNIAFSIDQMGNVWGGPMMNDCLLINTVEEKLYGNPDETISHVTGVNKLNKNLTALGRFVAKGLDKAEKNHVEKAAVTNQNNAGNNDFNLRKHK